MGKVNKRGKEIIFLFLLILSLLFLVSSCGNKESVTPTTDKETSPAPQANPEPVIGADPEVVDFFKSLQPLPQDHCVTFNVTYGKDLYKTKYCRKGRQVLTYIDARNSPDPDSSKRVIYNAQENSIITCYMSNSGSNSDNKCLGSTIIPLKKEEQFTEEFRTDLENGLPNDPFSPSARKGNGDDPRTVNLLNPNTFFSEIRFTLAVYGKEKMYYSQPSAEMIKYFHPAGTRIVTGVEATCFTINQKPLLEELDKKGAPAFLTLNEQGTTMDTEAKDIPDYYVTEVCYHPQYSYPLFHWPVHGRNVKVEVISFNLDVPDSSFDIPKGWTAPEFKDGKVKIVI